MSWAAVYISRTLRNLYLKRGFWSCTAGYCIWLIGVYRSSITTNPERWDLMSVAGIPGKRYIDFRSHMHLILLGISHRDEIPGQVITAGSWDTPITGSHLSPLLL